MKEHVGKICLDYTYYPGQDLYCDGVVEDEILQIVQTYEPSEFPRLIEERASWPILYHLSYQRGNIVEWLPIEKSHKVLEVGSGCGAITGTLAQKAGEVTCIDLSKKRSLINANRHKALDNIEIKVGNFKDIEQSLPTDYDYILLIGVFEYGKGYMGTNTPYTDFLQILKKHLKTGGRLVIAIENRLGLKYFAGCREDHLGDYFSGIENYPKECGVNTFSLPKLKEIFVEAGLEDLNVYYPYPDYKFMTTIFSDNRLPKQGELYDNLRNFDRDRMLLFDEKNAYDGLIEDGLFPLFSNSFVFVTGEPFPLMYAKYSNDRDSEYAIVTQILKANEHQKEVLKKALSPKAKAHIERIEKSYEGLNNRYAGGLLKMNTCYPKSDQEIGFEYLEGETLEVVFDNLLANKDEEGFYNLFRTYLDAISYHEEYGVSNKDLIFSNIILVKDQWHVIDYEWTQFETGDSREIAYRAFYCYQMGAQIRRNLDPTPIYEMLQLSPNQRNQIEQDELSFQKKITKNRRAMNEIRNLLGAKIEAPLHWEAKVKQLQEKRRMQIYKDFGAGFREADSEFLVAKEVEGNTSLLELCIQCQPTMKNLRIDPAMEPCMIQLTQMTRNGIDILSDKKRLETSGVPMGNHLYLFAHDDPNIIIPLSIQQPSEDTKITIRLQTIPMSKDIAKRLMKKKSLF